jgi:broad specificity phosphatase PhoE
MQLLLIRHGESENNELAGRLDHAGYMRTRTPDPRLTERGFAQAQALADYLSAPRSAAVPPGGVGRFGITEIHCSPMLRALQTAAPFVEALGLKARTWIDIHEQGGLFTGDPVDGEVVGYGGLTLADFARDHSGFETVDGITDAGWWQGDWEDLTTCHRRADRVAAELHERARRVADSGDCPVVALVSHGYFLNALLKALFGNAHDSRQYYFLNNTGMTGLEYAANGRLELRFHNRTEHLASELISE